MREAGTIAEGLRAVEEARPEVVLLDLRLPDGSGLDALPRVLAADPDVAVIMMTAYGSVADAVQAMQHGARDFVLKPLRPRRDPAAGRARGRRGPRAARDRLLPGARGGRGHDPRRIAGDGSIARAGGAPEPRDGAARRRTDRAPAGRDGLRQGTPRPGDPRHGRPARGTLHRGELHRASRAAGGGGAVRPRGGAFTDAKTARAGLFETADGGTIFLDEIGHVAPSLQAKFLKVVEENTVRRIGATAARAVDVQIIAATSRDIEAAVQLGEFREDLYQRLSVAVLRIPPSTSAGSDGCCSAGRHSSRRAGAMRRRASAVAAAEEAIRRHTWRANVRELQNLMERVVLFTDSDPVTADDLAPAVARRPWRASAPLPVARCRSTFPMAACRSRPSSARSWWPLSSAPAAIRPGRRDCSRCHATRCAIA